MTRAEKIGRLTGLPLTVAAKQLKVHPGTIRRWIREGCPTVSHGKVGRGRGSLVDLDAIARWQGQQILGQAATAFVDTLKRDEAHVRVDLSYGQAAGLLVLAYQRLWQNLTRQSLEDLEPPPEIVHLQTLWLEYAKTH